MDSCYNIKNKNFYTYGLDTKSNFCIKNIKQLKEYSEFDLNIKLPNKKNQLIKKFKIPLLGTHNIKNSVSAAALALTVGLPIKNIKKGDHILVSNLNETLEAEAIKINNKGRTDGK